MIYGEYLVTGSRAYRGHAPGCRFEARLNEYAEQRAIQRGAIQLLRVITPTVPRGAVFPDGWLPPPDVPSEATQGAPEGASLVREGG